ncbi:synaptic vesicular amine transporter-like protein, partial [Dinothrombium tinctorium]
IPFANKIMHLIVPHFGLGLGIGIIDAAMMPQLAFLMDTRYNASYGTVYAFAQMAVCSAYAFGPLFGGELMEAFGFTALIRSVGFVNILFALLVHLALKEQNEGKYPSILAEQSEENLELSKLSTNSTSNRSKNHPLIENRNYESTNVINNLSSSFVRFLDED